MIEILLGSKSTERVLFYLAARKEAYGREIADYYKTSLSPVQKQLERLESAGVLISKSVGRTRLYFFNPRYAFVKELSALINKAINFLPPEEQHKLIKFRTRPRRRAKP